MNLKSYHIICELTLMAYFSQHFYPLVVFLVWVLWDTLPFCLLPQYFYNAMEEKNPKPPKICFDNKFLDYPAAAPYCKIKILCKGHWLGVYHNDRRDRNKNRTVKTTEKDFRATC